MTTISIHQPHYHSWLGLLEKIASSDLHIILDDVQFRRRNYQNRVQICHSQGAKLLSVPVFSKGHQDQQLLIQDVELAMPDKLMKQFLTLKHCYSKHPGWKDIEHQLEEIYLSSYTHLIQLNIDLLKHALKLFSIETPMLFASELQARGQKSERILNLCIKAKGTNYLYGSGSASYMDINAFEQAGICAQPQQFKHPIYEQRSLSKFIPGCFALDWYLNDPVAACEHFNRTTSKSAMAAFL